MVTEGETQPGFTVLTVEIDIGQSFDIGPVSCGRRTAVSILGGRFEGPRLRGIVCPVGLDWSTRYSDGTGSMQASLVLRTEDGALIALHYEGSHSAADSDRAFVSGAPSFVESREMTIRCRFECADERYEWLDGVLAVADGRMSAVGTNCRLFALVR